jgi:hypothetical protein
MVILCVAGGTIFNVVNVFEVYYLPLQQAMGLSKSQIGMLLGVFGAILDNYPGLTGYRILFAGASIIAGIGVAAGWLLMRNRARS